MFVYSHDKENIKPFNECYYIDCFYNALFPILGYYNVPREVILNNYYHYYHNHEELGVEIKWHGVHRRGDVLYMHGIKETEIQYTDFIISDIRNILQEKKLVILYIDCFYEKNRYDTYLKKHWPHTILIYGYDDLNETFNIIEHSNRESLDYTNRTISYSEIEKCYASVLRLYSHNNKPTLYVYEKVQDSKYGKPLFSDYLSQIRGEIPVMLAGIEQLAILKRKMLLMIQKQDFYKQQIDNIIQLLNDIVNAKIAMEFTLEQYEQGIFYLDSLANIRKEWTSLRNVTVKSVYSREYSVEKLCAKWNTIELIMHEEKEFLKVLMSDTNCRR